MPLHPVLIAYGQLRGYDMSDFNRLVERSLFDHAADNSTHSANLSSNLQRATGMMVNLSEPSAYISELSLFASYYNTLPVCIRRRLRKYTEGMLAYFTKKLSSAGQPLDDLLLEFDHSNSEKDEPPSSTDNNNRGTIFDQSMDIRQLVDEFCRKFGTSLIRDYFLSETDIFAPALENDADLNSGVNNKHSDEEEDEDNVEDPPWWRKHEASQEHQSSDPVDVVDDDLTSLVDEIRDISSKLSKVESDSGNRSAFPYVIKMYSLSSTFATTRGRLASKPAATCADVAVNGKVACFGYNFDSSIKCFSLRQFDTSAKRPVLHSGEREMTVRANSTSGIIYRTAFVEHDDASLLLATSDETSGPITLFDLAASNEKIYSYRGHRWPVWALDVTKTYGGAFVTGSYDQTCRFFLLDRKDPLRVLVGHQSSVDCVRFIPICDNLISTDDANKCPAFVATASSDRTVRVWSLNDTIPVRMFHGMKGTPTALAFRSTSPSGANEKLLACATTEAKVYVWELERGRIYQILDGVLANDMEFSSDGRYLVAAGDSGCFKIFYWSDKGGELGSQYVEMQISDSVITEVSESKFLKVRFIGNELICLAAG